jgi:hypothetical protein
MYCNSCGNETPDQSMFCLYCNTQLNKECPRCAEIIKFKAHVCRYCGHEFEPIVIAEVEGVPQPEGDLDFISGSTGTSTGRKIASSGAALALICFFLPWMAFSCSKEPIVSLSGWELAAGTPKNIPGTHSLFLVLFAAIGIFILFFYAKKKVDLAKIEGFGLVVLGALPLLVIFTKIAEMQSELVKFSISVNYQLGFWGVIIGNIAVIVGGVLKLGENEASPQKQDSG